MEDQPAPFILNIYEWKNSDDDYAGDYLWRSTKNACRTTGIMLRDGTARLGPKVFPKWAPSPFLFPIKLLPLLHLRFSSRRTAPLLCYIHSPSGAQSCSWIWVGPTNIVPLGAVCYVHCITCAALLVKNQTGALAAAQEGYQLVSPSSLSGLCPSTFRALSSSRGHFYMASCQGLGSKPVLNPASAFCIC